MIARLTRSTFGVLPLDQWLRQLLRFFASSPKCSKISGRSFTFWALRIGIAWRQEDRKSPEFSGRRCHKRFAGCEWGNTSWTKWMADRKFIQSGYHLQAGTAGQYLFPWSFRLILSGSAADRWFSNRFAYSWRVMWSLVQPALRLT